MGLIGLTTSKVSYEVSLEEMKRVLANELGCTINQLSVEYVIREVGADPMDRFPGRNEVVMVRLTVDNKLGMK